MNQPIVYSGLEKGKFLTAYIKGLLMMIVSLYSVLPFVKKNRKQVENAADKLACVYISVGYTVTHTHTHILLKCL